jgi:hypothetical protein
LFTTIFGRNAGFYCAFFACGLIVVNGDLMVADSGLLVVDGGLLVVDGG